MKQGNANLNTDAVIAEKVKKQRTRILKAIDAGIKKGVYEITFYEEMFQENKDYFLAQGYLVKMHGGPQNTFFSRIDWSVNP
jgi:phage regulator Rha-like protein